MSIQLNLRKDYPGGLFDFLEAAEKAYKQVDVYAAVETSKESSWKAVKEIFLAEPSKPLFADIAAALERSIIAFASSAK